MNNVISRTVFSALMMIVCAVPGWSGGNQEVKTGWELSHGLQVGDDVYFLNYYYLYKPGTVIIPMFMVTPSTRFFTDLSLYRLAPGPQDRLERLWTSDKQVNLKNCRFARSGDKLYFTWVMTLPKEGEDKPLFALEYDLGSQRGRMVELSREDKEIATALTYHHPDALKRPVLWGRAGQLPLNQWELPSPLEYSSKNPRFLKKVITEEMVDRDFRAAALAELDAQGNENILRQILAETQENSRKEATFDTLKWEPLILMTRTLRGERPDDIFSAAFDNDTDALGRFLDSGADPDSTDDRGRTLMMWAVLGNAPDTMELLFTRGADPEKKSDCGLYPWYYAALSPLRATFLRLWGK